MSIEPADPARKAGPASIGSKKFGFPPGGIIQEYCLDEDAEQTLRAAVEAETGTELVDEDYGDVVDGALIWWRADDGEVDDLTDLLVDAAANLDDGGLLWVLSPKTGREGAIPPSEIEQAAKTAGLSTTSTTAMGEFWAGTRLTARPRQR